MRRSIEAQLWREHLGGHHAVIRHQACPACLANDRAVPRGMRPRRVPWPWLAKVTGAVPPGSGNGNGEHHP